MEPSLRRASFNCCKDMKISHEEVKHLALLARLGLSEEDAERFREQLSNILDNFQILQEVDTTEIHPTSHSIQADNVLREDEASPSLPVDEALSNAPASEENQFKVRAVLE